MRHQIKKQIVKIGQDGCKLQSYLHFNLIFPVTFMKIHTFQNPKNTKEHGRVKIKLHIMLLPEIWTPLSPVYLFCYTWQFVVTVSFSLPLFCQLTCPQGRTTVLHLLQSLPDQSSVAVGNPECLVLDFWIRFPIPSTNCDNTNTPNTTVILLMQYKTYHTCQLLCLPTSVFDDMAIVNTVLCFPSLAIVPDVSDFTQHR